MDTTRSIDEIFADLRDDLRRFSAGIGHNYYEPEIVSEEKFQPMWDELLEFDKQILAAYIMSRVNDFNALRIELNQLQQFYQIFKEPENTGNEKQKNGQPDATGRPSNEHS